MNVFELFAKLGLDKSEYDEGLSSAEQEAQSFGSAISSGLKTAMGIGAVAVTAVTTAVVGTSAAFVSGVSDVAQYADNIDKMSQKLNMSAETYQEWDFVMQHCGTTIDSMKTGMRTLSSAVETGNEAFEQLGLSQEELADLSAEELFSTTIEALQNVESETERTYLASQLLGRGATELGPLLNMTAEETEAMREEVHDLGGVMSDDAVKAGAQFQDSLQNMQYAMNGVKNNLLSEFLPSFSTVMDGLAMVFSGDEGGLAIVEQGVNDFADQMNETLPVFLEVAGNIIEVLSNALINNLPTLIQTGGQVLGRLAQGIINNLPTLISSAIMIVRMIAQGLISALPQLAEASLEIITMLGNALVEDLPTLMSTAAEVIAQLAVMLSQPDNITMLTETGIQILLAIANGLTEALPQLLAVVPEVVVNLVSTMMANSPMIINATLQILGALATAVLASLFSLMGMSEEEVLGGIEYIQNGVTNTFNSIVEFISGIFTDISDTMSAGIDAWISFFSDGFDDIYDTVSGILDDVLSVFTDIFDDVRGVVSSAVDFLISAFDFDWSLPQIQLPHFNVTGGEAPWGFGGAGTMPSISIDWYKKAYDQPMLLTDPTIFGYGNGSFLGGGDGAGGELIVGWNELLSKISENASPVIHVHNYIGGVEVDDFVVDSKQRTDFIAGGRG